MYQNLPAKVGFGPKSYSLFGSEYSHGIIISGRSIDIESTKNKIAKLTSSSLTDISVGEERTKQDIFEELVSEYKNDKTDFIVAIGGGSIIDFTKLFRERLILELASSPLFFVIPTMIGSGAESSMTAILNTEKGKVININEDFLPSGIIYDFNLLKNIPPERLLLGHVDAITHCVESLTSFNKNVYSEFLAINSLNNFLTNIGSNPIIFSSLERRDIAELSLLSFNGGICQNNSGAGLTHALAHSLESLARIDHAKSIAYFLPIALQYIYEIDESFHLKNHEIFNKYLEDLIDELHTTDIFYNIKDFLCKAGNLDECIKLASSDPCWRLFYKRIEKNRLKEIILESL